MSSPTLLTPAPTTTQVCVPLARTPSRFRTRFRTRPVVDRFLFENCLTDPELGRRARLAIWFGFLGFFFGVLYAVFYLVIDHLWGAGIIVCCSLGFLATPFLLRRFRSVAFAGNLLAALMALGFAGLCAVEGGLRGHAVAWLASVPLCALLLVGKRAAGIWVLISFAAAAVLVGLELTEIRVPILYDPAWQSLVDSAGYLGLIAFMFGLGLIFENGREQAFGKMTDALATTAEANEQLRVLNQEKTEFMGVAAHDLRNPLTIIITYAEMLRDGLGKDPSAFAGSIYQAGTRMRDLISNLLDSNAIEEGHFTCEITRCSVAELITEGIAQNQLHASRKGTEIVHFAGTELWARADRNVSIQILDNLLSNALKYAPPGTRVLVESGRDAGRIFIAIKDQGPGISDEDQAKLFGKYTRLTARPTGGESSTGLGLSIVKRLVEVMHGTIECRSQLGEGATFIVWLHEWDESAG